MNNLKNLLTKQLQVHRIPKWVFVSIVTLSLVGFSVATYLTVEHFRNVVPPCAIGGCETVLTSEYSEVFGLPVSLLGSLYYLLVLASVLVFFDAKSEKIKDLCVKGILLLSFVAAVVSLFYIALMLFVIKAICIYCMISDTISIIMLIIMCRAVYIAYDKAVVTYE